ncbi:helix-turn-helix transcriptional regulator [Psychrobacter pygoscelis]|uniref:helix-turn-helix transcriptional regulator n=1 Tax=Psychrobacter pygoscelis TaxID=2488563 RepID=UPI001F61CC24|nr:AlpA family phage regulatory protein [Psychrobacter pygoscelis]
MTQVCDKIGVSRATVYRMIDNGEFPAQRKDGSSSFWFEHELDKWLAERHNLETEAG